MRRLHIICEDDIFRDFGFVLLPWFSPGEPRSDLKHFSLAGADLEAGVGALFLGAGSLFASLLEV